MKEIAEVNYLCNDVSCILDILYIIKTTTRQSLIILIFNWLETHLKKNNEQIMMSKYFLIIETISLIVRFLIGFYALHSTNIHVLANPSVQ